MHLPLAKSTLVYPHWLQRRRKSARGVLLREYDRNRRDEIVTGQQSQGQRVRARVVYRVRVGVRIKVRVGVTMTHWWSGSVSSQVFTMVSASVWSRPHYGLGLSVCV